MIKQILPVAILMLAVTVSCKKKEEEVDNSDPLASKKTNVKSTYASIASAMYTDAHDRAVELKSAIDAFVANPTSSSLETAKQEWLESREAYGQSEIFRFVDGPIDNPANGPEGLINAWPMDEAFVDYVQGNANSGIINDLTNYPQITKDVLVSANELGGVEANVSVGYHAIEFLLWGQDLSASGPGNRPYTDFVTGAGGTASNQDRRGQYLKFCAELLVEALAQVKGEWASNGAYRATWLATDNKIALRRMFNSIRAMSGDELSGERIRTAYDNMDQEDEHSCFSDNTHRDIILNATGMKSLYLGAYTTTQGQIVSGYSLSDLVSIVDASQNSKMLLALQNSISKADLIYNPFDQAIILQSERPKVLETINALLEVEHENAKTAKLFDITF